MENLIKLSAAFSALILLSIASCKKDNNEGPQQVGEGFYVLCEGNFNWGNASVSSYDEVNDKMRNNFFMSQNDFALGDVAQSMYAHQGNYYLVVNNSSKIEVIQKDGFQYQFTIEGFDSPRYFLPVNDSLAYVTELWSGQIHIIDYLSGAMVSSIPVNGWSEEMERVEDTVYVSLYDDKSISLIDPATHELFASIDLEYAPLSLRKDANGDLWVVTGEFQGNSQLVKIDTESRSIEETFEFESENPLSRIAMHNSSESIFLIRSNGEIYKESIYTSSITNELFEANIDYVYGMEIDSKGRIYVCDAHDFVQAGSVYIYEDTGVKLGSYSSGINPNSIIFR